MLMIVLQEINYRFDREVGLLFLNEVATAAHDVVQPHTIDLGVAVPESGYRLH
jgi:hypothetical protein